MKINLIPEVRQEQLKAQKTNTIVTTVVIIVASILVGVIFLIGAMYIARTTIINQNNASIVTLNQKLKALAPLEKTVLNVQEGIKDVKDILATDNKWGNFFSDLEKATPDDIRFKSLNITADGKISASLEGKEVGSIDRFITAFSQYKRKDTVTNTEKGNLFSDVKVSGYSTNESDHVLFSATLTLNDKEL